jgi:hypothetical protein
MKAILHLQKPDIMIAVLKGLGRDDSVVQPVMRSLPLPATLDLPARRRLDRVRQDLEDLGRSPPENLSHAVQPPPGGQVERRREWQRPRVEPLDGAMKAIPARIDPSTAIGWLWVAEGSTLGAASLLKRAAALGPAAAGRAGRASPGVAATASRAPRWRDESDTASPEYRHDPDHVPIPAERPDGRARPADIPFAAVDAGQRRHRLRARARHGAPWSAPPCRAAGSRCHGPVRRRSPILVRRRPRGNRASPASPSLCTVRAR